MVAAVTALNQQIKSLAPLLNSANIPNIVSVTTPSGPPPVDTMVKASGKVLYVFSAVTRAGTTRASYAIGGLTTDAVANVVGEGRTIIVVAGKLSDDFAANGVHIYQIDLSTITCN